jgi:hypothetical protein
MRNRYVGKVLPAHVVKGNGRVEVQLLLFITSVPDGMCPDGLVSRPTNWQHNATCGKVTDCTLYWQYQGFDSRSDNKFCSLQNALSTLGLTKPPAQQVLGVRRPKRDADHSPPFSTDVKNKRSNSSTVPTYLHGTSVYTHAYLKQKDCTNYRV